MNTALLKWLGAKPHRGTVVNVVMLSAVLGLAGSAGLYRLIGGGAILVAAVSFLAPAVRLTVKGRGPARLHRLLLIWVPGVLAAALTVAGLAFAVSSAPASLAYCVGAALFAVELAMLTVAGADLREGALPGGALRSVT